MSLNEQSSNFSAIRFFVHFLIRLIFVGSLCLPWEAIFHHKFFHTNLEAGLIWCLWQNYRNEWEQRRKKMMIFFIVLSPKLISKKIFFNLLISVYNAIFAKSFRKVPIPCWIKKLKKVFSEWHFYEVHRFKLLSHFFVVFLKVEFLTFFNSIHVWPFLKKKVSHHFPFWILLTRPLVAKIKKEKFEFLSVPQLALVFWYLGH